jgi:hypothetical protein
MLKYVLEPEDVEDENLLSHWTDVLFHLHNIRQKFPRPTASFLEIDNEVFNKKVMRVDNNCLRIDSNHAKKWLDSNKEDIKVLGDITLENCEKDLTVIGNINGNTINVKGDLKADTICNFGNLTIYCEKLNTDDLRVSGTITIHSKENICSDFYSDNSVINGNINTTFYSSNNTKINGDIKAVSASGFTDDNLKVDLNKP